ncbi:putative Secreted Protein (HCD family) [Cryptosporidium hominis]|uniref:Secreted Protein (HCD family) n=2 Tax=Cryptosporidium hominis TaxID=237895 RepID=A0ABX5BB55_CRYHO|nr:putative Secreted Protein (HCD family) [Cryptosporidium hominis]|eukprot:PPS93450.1 putative Secreted Protein (HCD family) [Cryptosporidium hominis]
MIPKFNLVFLILFILIKIEHKRLIVMAKDSSDKIAKRFFVNQDKPQWQRTQAPREEIAIICHILSLGPIECIKYNEREFDGANPGHEEYMGFFIQYGMFGAVALAHIKSSSRSKIINSELEVEKNKITEMINMFKIPKKVNDLQIIESCEFDIDSLLFKLEDNPTSVINHFEYSSPTEIALKISFHSSYTRELYYTSLLSKQNFPLIPVKTYGRGKIRITPRTYCLQIEKNIVLNRILITEKINGVTMQVLVRWLTSIDYLNWISSAKTIKELQKRLDNRAEIIWILVHSFFSTLTSLYIHSDFGYILHCDLNTGNIQVANTKFNLKGSNYQENVDSLLKVTPNNIKILDFGTTRSTLEMSVRSLKCNVPNDIWRIKLIISRLFKIDSTTHPNLFGWTIDFQKNNSDLNYIKRSRILNHINSLDLFREELLNNNDFKNAMELNSTFESIIDGLDSICDITVNHISKFKEFATNIVNNERFYASCSPLDPSNARGMPIKLFKPEILGQLQIPLFPDKSAMIKKTIREERKKALNQKSNKSNESNNKVKDSQDNLDQPNKGILDANIKEKNAVQGGVSPGGIHGIGVGSTSNSKIPIKDLQYIKNNKAARPDTNIVASSIGVVVEANADGNNQFEMPKMIQNFELEQEKISKISSLKQVCNYVEQSKSRDARKLLNKLKMKNSVLRDITMDIDHFVKRADKILLEITENIKKKPQKVTSDQDRLKMFEVSRSKLRYIAKSCPVTLSKINEENSEAAEKVNIGIVAFENERQRILKRCNDLRNFIPRNENDTVKAKMKTKEIIERGKTLLQYRFHINDSMKCAFDFLFRGIRRVQRLVELSQESMKGDLLLEENLELLLDKIAEYKV